MRPAIPSLPPEEQLVLLCARREFTDTHRTAAARILSGPFQWEEFLRVAGRQAVLPLVAKHLRELKTDIPAPVSARLRDFSVSTGIANRVRTRELVSILSALKDLGVPALAYKGPSLALQVYGDIALRQFNDLDIVIPKSGLGKTRQLLESMGYCLAEPEMERYHLGYCPHLAYRKPGRTVEIHWQLFYGHFPDPMPYGQLAPARELIQWEGISIPVLGKAESALALAVHGHKHYWARLELTTALALFVAGNNQADWDALVALGSARGYGRVLRVALLIAAKLYDLVFPGMAEANDEFGVVADAAIDASFDRSADHSITPGLLWRQMALLETLRDRARFAAHYAFVPKAEDWAILPGPGAWLVHPLRVSIRALRLRRGK